MNKESEKIYLVTCLKCNNQQQTIVRVGSPIGKRRKCVYCGRGFSLSKINIIRRVK